jgi:long-subunit fatty acid transport protein
MVDAIDAGGRAMGAGSAFNLSSVSTLSATYNPAALAFVERREIGAAMRTFPTTQSSVSGPLNALRSSSDTETGAFRASHFGLALPLRNKGALGLAWTVGGWFHDTQTGVGLPNGVATYFDFTRMRTDFYNLSYGVSSNDGQFAWGAGVIMAQTNIRNSQIITFTDINIPPQIASTNATGNGFGAQVGIMLTPKGRRDVTIAASARTPIDIDDEDGELSLYNRIPGRIAVGVATRRDGFRGGRDYLVLGAEGQYFFGGKDSPRIDRENHGTAHFGAEYNYGIGSATIPVRVGYSIVPRGGDGFSDRNTLSFGFGYRPNNGDWSIEVNFGSPTGGGSETGVFFSYRFK